MLAGCGSNTSSGSASGGQTLGLDSVKIGGNVGTAPTVNFSGKVTDPTTTTKVLVNGTGPQIKQGDSLILQTVIADGKTQKTVASSYKDQQPQVVTLSSQVTPIFLNALTGKNVGSRVLVYTTADKIFGPTGNSQLGISSKDVVLILFDLIGKPIDKPNGASHAAPSWAPSTVQKKGVISGLDFSKTSKPDGALHVAALRSGTGAVIKKGQTIFVRYLGEVYHGKTPFDQNFTGANAATPASFQIGVGKVVKGWDKTLVGQRVGSQVVLAIPPKDGYGKAGSPSAHIKGTDTLYFVVDIVGAA